MGNPRFDAVIVGARCSGAALATLLARSGMKVLMVDKDPRHTDHVLSTHTIHPPGIDVLDMLGVGDAIRERAPASRVIRLAKGGAHLDFGYRDGRAEYCPRRARLDGLIQDAASSAGAEFRDRTRLVEVLFEDGRACGVRLHRNGHDEVVHAGVVVGADGRHSTVAQQVGAKEYLGYDAPRAMYWGYWNAPKVWHDASAYPFDMYISNVAGRVNAIFQTDDDQLLIGSLPPVEDARHWKADARRSLFDDLEGDEVTAPLVRDNPPDGQIRGTIKERYFFRDGAGPGWALVGDAGHHKDFVLGDGITEGLIQARSLAPAIEKQSDAALMEWWRERDVKALPLYFFGQDEGRPGSPLGFQSMVIGEVGRDPEVKVRMAAIMEHELSPYDAIPPRLVMRCLAKSLMRGRFSAVGEFLAMGKRAAEVNREVRKGRKRLRALQHQVASGARD